MVDYTLQNKLEDVVKSYEELILGYEKEIQHLQRILEDPFYSTQMKQVAWAGLRLKFKLIDLARKDSVSQIQGLFTPKKGAL